MWLSEKIKGFFIGGYGYQLNAKAWALFRSGKYEDTIRYADEANRTFGEYFFGGWLVKAHALCALGKYEEAMVCYYKAIEVAKRHGCSTSEIEEGKKVVEEKLRKKRADEIQRKQKEKERKEAPEAINTAQEAIKRAENLGLQIYSATSLLNEAKSAFNSGDYSIAVEKSKIAEEEAKRIVEESKPEIEIDLSEKSFKLDYWKTVNLTVRNKGNIHAKDIKIDFSKEAEIKGLEMIELKSGEEKRLKIAFRPIQVGEVPLAAKITYMDLDNREYKGEQSFWIGVGEEPPRKEEIEIPIEKKERALTIERAIYDPCKGDFIEKPLPRMKEWINRYDPSAYWFAISLQNNTDRAIDEWGAELETSSALKVEKAIIEGVEYKIGLHETHPEPYKNVYAIGVPKEYGIVIPKGGAQRVYFKLRADKPKTVYEISGVFKSKITGDVPIRAKEFKYLCDAGSLRGAILEHPEAALEYVETQVKRYSYSPAELSAIVKGVDIVSGICRMCASRYPKRADVRSEVEKLKGYLENVEDNLGQSYNDFEMLVREMDAVPFEETVPEDYAERIKRKCLVFPDELLAKLQRQSIKRGG